MSSDPTQPQAPQTPNLIPIPDFAKMVRDKYPGAYDNVDDKTLVRGIFRAHPGANDKYVENPFNSLGDDPVATISKEIHRFPGLIMGSTQRSPAEQQKLINEHKTKATNSYHLYNQAVDIKGGTPEQRAQFYEYMRQNYGTNLAELLNEPDLNHVHIGWNKPTPQAPPTNVTLSDVMGTGGVPSTGQPQPNQPKTLGTPTNQTGQPRTMTSDEASLYNQYSKAHDIGDSKTMRRAGLALQQHGWEYGETTPGWPYIKPPTGLVQQAPILGTPKATPKIDRGVQAERAIGGEALRVLGSTVAGIPNIAAGPVQPLLHPTIRNAIENNVISNFLRNIGTGTAAQGKFTSSLAGEGTIPSLERTLGDVIGAAPSMLFGPGGMAVQQYAESRGEGEGAVKAGARGVATAVGLGVGGKIAGKIGATWFGKLPFGQYLSRVLGYTAGPTATNLIEQALEQGKLPSPAQVGDAAFKNAATALLFSFHKTAKGLTQEEILRRGGTYTDAEGVTTTELGPQFDDTKPIEKPSDPLKGGVYIIRHGTTEANEGAKKEQQPAATTPTTATTATSPVPTAPTAPVAPTVASQPITSASLESMAGNKPAIYGPELPSKQAAKTIVQQPVEPGTPSTIYHPGSATTIPNRTIQQASQPETWVKYNTTLSDLADQHNVELIRQDLRTGGVRPSIGFSSSTEGLDTVNNNALVGNPDDIKYIIAKAGKANDQLGSIYWSENPNGKGEVTHISYSKSLTPSQMSDLIDALQKNGIGDATISPNNKEIIYADRDGTHTDNLTTALNEYSNQHPEVALEPTQHFNADIQTIGANEYDNIIQNFEQKGQQPIQGEAGEAKEPTSVRPELQGPNDSTRPNQEEGITKPNHLRLVEDTGPISFSKKGQQALTTLADRIKTYVDNFHQSTDRGRVALSNWIADNFQPELDQVIAEAANRDEVKVRPAIKIYDSNDPNKPNVWLLVWRPLEGTRFGAEGTPIHGHGPSHAAIRVYKGTVTENIYTGEQSGRMPTTGEQANITTRNFPEGSSYTLTSPYVHDVLNTSDKLAVTIHTYDPRLGQMEMFTIGKDGKLNLESVWKEGEAPHPEELPVKTPLSTGKPPEASGQAQAAQPPKRTQPAAPIAPKPAKPQTEAPEPKATAWFLPGNVIHSPQVAGGKSLTVTRVNDDNSIDVVTQDGRTIHIGNKVAEHLNFAFDNTTAPQVGEQEQEKGKALGVVEKSLGAAATTQPSHLGSEAQQLGKALKATAATFEPTKTDYTTGQKLGKKIEDVKASIKATTNSLVDSTKQGWANFRSGVKPESDHATNVHNWQYEKQENAGKSQQLAQDVRSAIPSQLVRDAMSVWIDAGGDAKLLQEGVARSKNPEVYQMALNLKPEEIVEANHIKAYMDAMWDKGSDEGILKGQQEDYINRVYDKRSAKIINSNLENKYQQGGLPTNFVHAKQRFYETILDAEEAGLKPKTRDVADLIPLYNQQFGDVLAARKFVQAEQSAFDPKGRPLIVPAGSAQFVYNPEGKSVTFVNPNTKPSSFGQGKNKIQINPDDYEPYDNPAFRQQKFVSANEDNEPTILKADALVLKDYAKEFHNRFDPSKVDEYAIGRGAKWAKNQGKALMMVGGFHQANIDVHALMHRVWNPYEGGISTPIDLGDPQEPGIAPEIAAERTNTQLALKSGVKAFDSQGSKVFAEGTGSGAWVHQIPYAGDALREYTDWLFTNHIPRIKLQYFKQALDRNMSRAADDIASGKVTETQIQRHTAEETNAAFGELNYDVLGTSKTTQDVLGLMLMAPDFTRARVQYVKQALQPYGREQQIALLAGAATMYVGARVLNGVLNNGNMYINDPDKLFKVHIPKGFPILGDTWVGIRSVPEDLLNLVTAPGQFVMNRANPIAQMTKTLIEGTDRFGKKVDPDTKLNRLKQAVPKTLGPMFISKDVDRSVAQFLGFQTAKESDTAKALKNKEDVTEKVMEKTGLPRKAVENAERQYNRH